MPTLKIIVTSTREGRKGRAIADWFFEKARSHGKWDVELVDLKEVDLPMMNEPNHPNQQRYTHDHTRAWSEVVAGADAFVFVLPEYNYAMPPAFVNAVDYLYREWNYKAAGFVSYGGISGGTRAAHMARQFLSGLKVVAIPEAVALPFFAKSFDDQGRFSPDAHVDPSVTAVLDELFKWNTALATLRR